MRTNWPLATGLLAVLALGCDGARAQTAPLVYVPNFTPGDVSAIDTSTNLPFGAPLGVVHAYAVAVSGDQSFAYVTNLANVTLFNTATNAVVTTIPMNSPSGAALTSDGRTLYVANRNSSNVTVIDTATNAVIATIPVGTGPEGIAITPDGRTVYVANSTSGTISVINAATNAVSTTIPGFALPFGTVVSPDGSTAYVSNFTAGTVTPINTATNTPGAPIVVGVHPIGIGISPDGRFLYVANQGTNNVSVINTSTGTVIAAVPAGAAASGVAVSPDGRFAYVTNQASNDVTIIDTATNTVVTTLATGTDPLFPGVCSNGNALLASGLTFRANSAGALGCTQAGVTGAAGPVFTGGTMQFIANNITSALPITLAAAGGTIDTNGNNATLNGTISGTGGLTKTGAGTLTLGGANTYTGGTTITAGTIAVTDDSNLGSIAGGLTFNGGTLRVSSGGGPAVALARAITLQAGGGTVETAIATILTGNITGTGGLTKTGTAILSLAGTNNYTGATNVLSGQLQSDSAGAFSAASAFTVAAGAAIELRGSQQSMGSLAGVGAVTNNNVAPAVLTTGFDNTSTTFSGVMSDAIVGPLSLVKVGSGKLTLSGVNTYIGTTTVNGGTLAVDGSIASASLTTVNAGGTLGGNGIVGNTTINGGTLAPGNSIGLLTVQGNLVFTAASSYMIEVSPSVADRTNVTGTATLGGATVNASFAAGTYVAKQYTILNAAGGVSGTFAGPANTNLPANFKTSLSYDANNAYLNLLLSFIPPPSGGLNQNQQNVANAIVNFFNTNGGIPLVFGGLTPAGLTQASGESATGSQQATFDAMNLFMGLLTDPFIAGRGDPISAGGNPNAFANEEGLAYAARGKSRPKSEREAYAAVYTKAPPVAPAFEQRWSVWAAGYGGSQTTDGNAAQGSNNTASRIAGTAVGADYRFSPFTMAGFALAGGGTNFSIANGLGSGRSDLFQAGAFIRHNVGPAYLTGALAYGWQDITTDRTVTVAGVDRLRAQFNANAWSGRVEGGYRFVSQGFGWTPYTAAQFTTFDLPAYAEQAIVGSNVFALAYNSKSVTDSRSELGLRSDKSFAMQNAILTLRGRAAWAHDFNPNRAIGATFQTLPGASFFVNGAAMASDAALVTGSAEVKWINGWSIAGTFEGEFSNVTQSYAGKGVVRYAW